HIGNLPHLPLGEEDIALGERLGTLHQLLEELPLHVHAFIERQRDGSLETANHILRCAIPARLLLYLLSQSGEERGVAARGCDLVFTIANLLERCALTYDAARELDGAAAQLTFGHD